MFFLLLLILKLWIISSFGSVFLNKEKILCVFQLCIQMNWPTVKNFLVDLSRCFLFSYISHKPRSKHFTNWYLVNFWTIVTKLGSELCSQNCSTYHSVPQIRLQWFVILSSFYPEPEFLALTQMPEIHCCFVLDS